MVAYVARFVSGKGEFVAVPFGVGCANDVEDLDFTLVADAFERIGDTLLFEGEF